MVEPLSQELLDFIAEWKHKPGNLIAVLHKVQEEYGYIPRSVAFQLVDLVNVPLGKLYSVITFYHFFRLTPPGKYIISVCTGTACYLKGADDLLHEIKSILGIDVNEVTKDGKFSVEAVRCVGCCGLAPVISINGKVYGRLTKDKIPEILSKYE